VLPFLINQIDKVLSQKINYEVIVIDDNSPDGTAAVVNDLAHRFPVRVVVRYHERGLAYCGPRNTWNNAGLAAPLKVIGRLLETMSAPLMEYYVPRAKLGVFYGMAEDWLKLHPTANPTELRAAMQRIWDSVDNRMGEMVYDNLFWDKTTKDIAYMTTRAVGWNLGTVREIFGGMADLVRNGAKLMKTGDFKAFQDAFTERMAYSTAMPIMTMYMKIKV
jgi:glycosyltransferase involved in cell wall biosynthesis